MKKQTFVESTDAPFLTLILSVSYMAGWSFWLSGVWYWEEVEVDNLGLLRTGSRLNYKEYQLYFFELWVDI